MNYRGLKVKKESYTHLFLSESPTTYIAVMEMWLCSDVDNNNITVPPLVKFSGEKESRSSFQGGERAGQVFRREREREQAVQFLH